MIKKIIALIFVSFFVMSGITVLTENNQNYQISNNQINNFVNINNNPIINLTYDSSYTLPNLYISGLYQYASCYDNKLYYTGYDSTNTTYGIYTLSNGIASFSYGLTGKPNALGIYSGILFISYASTNNICYINLSNNQKTTLSALSPCVYYPLVFYNNSIIYEGNSGGGILSYNIKSSATTTLICFLSPSGNGYNLYSNGNYISVTGDSSSSITPEYYVYSFSHVIQSGNTQISSMQSIYQYGNVTYIPNDYQGMQYDNGFKTFSTTAITCLPYTLGMTNYDNFSFIPYNIYYSTLGSESNSFYPQFHAGYSHNTFLYSTKNNQEYYLSGISNFSSSYTNFLVQGKDYEYYINQSSDKVFLYFAPNFLTYQVNVKSFNSLNFQINNYFYFNGIIYNDLENSITSVNSVFEIKPLNYSSYQYNGSEIITTQSDFILIGNVYTYNLSIRYSQLQSPSIPLYNIFTYMYPISIIGLFVGMGAFVFAIKKRGYKIWIL